MNRLRTILVMLWALRSLIVPVSALQARVSAFTYQGRLTDGAVSASGLYHLELTIYDSENQNLIVAGPFVLTSFPISNGLVTFTLGASGAKPQFADYARLSNEANTTK